MIAPVDVLEQVIADSNEQAFADFVSSVLEIVMAVDEETAQGILIGIAEELGLATDESDRQLDIFRSVIETIEVGDFSTRFSVFNTLIAELGLAQEQINAFMLVALDWDTLAYQFASAEMTYDAIYIDEIEVLYGNAPSATVDDDGDVVFRYIA